MPMFRVTHIEAEVEPPEFEADALVLWPGANAAWVSLSPTGTVVVTCREPVDVHIQAPRGPMPTAHVHRLPAGVGA